MALATLHNSTLRSLLLHRLKTCALPFHFPISSFPISHFPFLLLEWPDSKHVFTSTSLGWACERGYTSEWNMVCQITRTLLRRQLLHEVGHLLGEAGQLSFYSMIWSWSANSSANSCWSEGVAERLRHKSRPSVGKCNNILTTSFNKV